MSDFEKAVYEYLRQIPGGKVVTYGQIGAHLGSKYLARAVGNALHANPDGDLYPCYKVVNAAGKLSERYAFGGMEQQKRRLEAEGIPVTEDRVDLSRYQYRQEG